MHVLIADGCERTRAELRARLIAAGHAVAEADSAVSALVTAEQHPRCLDAVIIADSIPVIHGGRTYGRSEFGWSVILTLRTTVPRARLLLVLDAEDAETRQRAASLETSCEVRGSDFPERVIEWLARQPPPRAPARNVLRIGGGAEVFLAG